MAFNIEQENQRHAEGWNGFIKFVASSVVAIIIVLGLMALFLL